jgi:tetratricopeptide (TPR) repeat protein
MTGPEHLDRAFQYSQEFDLDDPRVAEELDRALEARDLDAEERGLAHAMRGNAYSDTRQFEAAVEHYQAALGLRHDSAFQSHVNHLLGEAYSALERFPQAIRHLRAALGAARDHALAPDTLIILGESLYNQAVATDDPTLLDEAVNAYTEADAILTSPFAENYHTRLGGNLRFLCLVRMGVAKAALGVPARTRDGIEDLEQAEALALRHRDEVSNEELALLYDALAGANRQLGLEREAQLAGERLRSNVR